MLMLFVLGDLLYFSCSSVKSKEDYPEDLRISFGSGGGSSGGWSGWIIDSIGNVYSWKGGVQEENTKFIYSLNKKIMGNLWKEITDINLMGIKYQEPGNFSKYIKIKANGKTNTILWNPYSKDEIINKLNALDSILFEKIKPENQR
jgi:hypothetical protein